MPLQTAVENHYERAYCKMMDDTEMQDAKKEWIESRVNELAHSSKEEYNDEIEDIYKEQAEAEYNKKFNEWRYK